MELIENSQYQITHQQKKPYMIHESGVVSAYEQVDLSGCYEYMGRKGHKHHFFNNETGVDLFFQTKELEGKVKAASRD
jgi:hypothetical protein